ncbi:MAG: [Fe-Fe] hydrogenase large subunit C-terminal domain-containing protein [Bacillota bacterium]|nr:[Fe-Fe] hydrogenase large subunit C-terminal domain-containing protein [Bacillota bacterium]
MSGQWWRRVERMLAAGGPVAVSLAPSYVAAFEASPGQVVAALKALGFPVVEETASVLGKMVRRREEMAREVVPVLSGSCPVVRRLIAGEFPWLLPHVEPVSALGLHVAELRQRYPGVRVVFVGPCEAKRVLPDRAAPDAVLTFREVACWWRARGIDPGRCERAEPDRAADAIGRISVAVVHASGLEECRRLLPRVAVPWEGLPYLELTACPGGCLNGPGMPPGDAGERCRKVVRYAREAELCVW